MNHYFQKTDHGTKIKSYDYEIDCDKFTDFTAFTDTEKAFYEENGYSCTMNEVKALKMNKETVFDLDSYKTDTIASVNQMSFTCMDEIYDSHKIANSAVSLLLQSTGTKTDTVYTSEKSLARISNYDALAQLFKAEVTRLTTEINAAETKEAVDEIMENTNFETIKENNTYA